VRYKRATRYVLLIALAVLAPALFTNLVPRAHAVTYSLGTIPFLTQEGSTITLVFSVSGATGNTLPIQILRARSGLDHSSVCPPELYHTSRPDTVHPTSLLLSNLVFPRP